MIWNEFEPLAHLIDGLYEKKITVPKGELQIAVPGLVVTDYVA